MKHPIGFRPSYPRMIVNPFHKDKAEEVGSGQVGAVASTTLHGDDEVPYEDKRVLPEEK